MLCDHKLVEMANCLTLSSNEVYLVQKARHPIELNHIDDVVLFCKSLKSQLKFLVLDDAAPAELRLAAIVQQTATVVAQCVLNHVGKIVGSKRILALDLVFVVLLGGFCEQGVLRRVNLLSVTA